jgi:APA family basic amino acid/polyamine antiporter
MALTRSIGLWGAVWMGLGSILGTGVFVSLGIAAGVSDGIVTAVLFAALLATANGFSSAQLAAAHPVSGGTYAYGYRFLNPQFGFLAGWLFLFAKSASAATAALGCSGYILEIFGIQNTPGRTALAVTLILVTVAAALVGMQRTARINTGIVLVTLTSLTAYIVFGASSADWSEVPAALYMPGSVTSWLEASALAFVAFTGYGRIATLGEEVIEPRRTIPRAVIVTLAIAALTYTGVTAVSVMHVGVDGYANLTRLGAALPSIAQGFPMPEVAWVVRAGAIFAMFGVLLNLVLGLSRVLYAMGQKADMPQFFGVAEAQLPRRAVIGVGAAIALLALIGDLKTTWSFSAFTVLLYYSITNLAAIRMPSELRLYPIWTAWFGLVACLGLAFFIDPVILGLGTLGSVLAFVVHHLYVRRRA